MLLLIIFINAISYLALLYQYQSNINLIQNNNDIITMGNNTYNDFHVDNNNTSHRFLMQPRIYNI
jgi:hypothetical protein